MSCRTRTLRREAWLGLAVMVTDQKAKELRDEQSWEAQRSQDGRGAAAKRRLGWGGRREGIPSLGTSKVGGKGW